VSVGLVSALGRRVTSANGTLLPDMIQTNASPSANAAAVLVDATGSVLGLLAADASHTGSSGASTTIQATETSVTTTPTLVQRYATPIDYASKVANEIIATGKVAHPWLGVETADLTGDQLADAGRPGARIDRVIAASPALRSGLLVGDVVTAVDGSAVTSSAALTALLRRDLPNQVIRITYLREGTHRVAVATLSDRSS